MIEELIKKIAGRMFHVINFEAEVVSVDQDKDTCVVQAVDGDKIDEVKLKSILSDQESKFVLYPKVGSFVTCSILQNLPTECYVSQYSEIDKVVWNCEEIIINGGDKGGLVNWTDAKAQHDLVKNFITAFKNTLTTPIPEAGNGAPSAFQAALNTALGSIQAPNFDNLEDTKVKH
jgi:hypothetical protein